MSTASNLSTEQIDLAQKQRVALLFALYDLSDRNVHKPISLQEAAKKVGIDDYNHALSVASYLDAKGVFSLAGGGWGGRMTVEGIDLVEKDRSPLPTQEKNSPATSVVINNNNSPGANFNLGSGKIQQSWVELTSQRIDKTQATSEEKQEAKSLLTKISENKLLNTIIGAAVGELTKAALPKRTWRRQVWIWGARASRTPWRTSRLPAARRCAKRNAICSRTPPLSAAGRAGLRPGRSRSPELR